VTPRRLFALLAVLALLAGGAVLLLLRGSEPAAADAPLPTRATAEEPPPPVLPEALPAETGDDDGAGGARSATAIDTSGAASSVTARVIDRAGHAVPAARVAAFAREDDPPFRSRRELDRHETTGDDGRFRFVGLPAGADLGVEVEHPDFATEVRETFRATPGGDLDLGDIVMQDGLRLHGTVTGADNLPLAGATVTLSDVTAMLARPDAAPGRSTTTDDAGQYAFPHLAARQYELQASAAGHGTTSLVLSLVLGGGMPELKQDFQLERADSQLGGWVLGPDDKGVPDVPLTLTRSQTQGNTYFLERGRTDKDGRFDFADVPAGVYLLDLAGDEHYVDRPVQVMAGPDDQVVRAQAALVVHGVLDGLPGPTSFRLRVQPDGRTGAGMLGRRQDTQELQGDSFEVRGLRPGSYRFEVQAPGFAVSSSPDVILGPGQGRAEVLITMQRGGEVLGRLQPAAAGIRAELRESDWDPASPIESTFPTAPAHGLVTTTDGDGRFQLDHVPAATYVLTLRPQGAPPIHVRDVLVQEGGSVDVGTLQVEKGGSVFGNVVGPDGRERAGVRVSATSERHQAQVQTDAQGAFRLDALPPGDYELQATPATLWEALRFGASAHVTLHGGEELGVALTLVERATQPR
jgi:Carboxypeptidase regulatory-like domain